MKKLLVLITGLVFLACNGPNDPPDETIQVKQDSVTVDTTYKK